MHRFARLFEQLTHGTDAATQVALLLDYLRDTPAPDAAWAVTLLAGASPGLRLPPQALRASARQASGLPDWLFDTCLAASGDLSDTLAQVIPIPPAPDPAPLAEWVEQRLHPLRGQPTDTLIHTAAQWWTQLSPPARYVLAKLLSAGWRSPVSPQVLQAALAHHAQRDPRTIAQRLSHFLTAPDITRHTAYQTLITPDPRLDTPPAHVYPFALHGLTSTLPDDVLNGTAAWWIFWHHDGLPAQLVKRQGSTCLWLADDRLVNDHIPEVIDAARPLPDGTVLEGQLLIWPSGATRPDPARGLAARLKHRPAGRATASRHPVRFIAQDLLEDLGIDLRTRPFSQRRQALAARVPTDLTALAIAPRLPAPDEAALARLQRDARREGALGLVLRHPDGRPTAAEASPVPCWVWPTPALSVLAVLVYAQTGGGMTHGYAHYSFAVWNRSPTDGDEVVQALRTLQSGTPPSTADLHLVTVAKVSADDTGPWHAALTQCVQSTVTSRQGPVHTVHPGHLVELHVGGLSQSARHKCGLHLQAVRVHRTRSDKALHDADTLAVLQAMLDGPGP